MSKSIFITGVGTGVGKTVATSAIAHLLSKTFNVGLMKPVQTGSKNKRSDDLDFTKKILGVDDPYNLAVPYLFKTSISPYHASLKEKKQIDLDIIKKACDQILKTKDVVVMEGAGGLMVPLTDKLFWADFVRLTNAGLVIVADTKLGMIHNLLSTVITAESYGLKIIGIVLVDTVKTKKPAIDEKWIEKSAGYPIIGTIPFTTAIKGEKVNVKKFRCDIEKSFSIKQILKFIKSSGSKQLQKKFEEADRKYVWHPFTQMNEWMDEDILFVDSATNMKLSDIHGKEYFDGHSSYWVNMHGHGEPKLVRSLMRQTAKLDHATFLGLSHKPAVELAERLIKITPKPLQKVFYSDNGSSAVEIGLKMAFQYFRQRDKKPTKSKTKFMALGLAYHGDTLGAVAVGGVEMYRNKFAPLLAEAIFAPSPYCYRCPLSKSYPSCSLACADEMERLLKKHHKEISAFIIEPMVQCPGGIITSPIGYLKRVRQACTKYDVVMIADEVAVGFGRTGKMFACEHEQVEPDIMAISKSIGAGLLPLAATLATDEIYNAFLGSYESKKTFFHGHTFTAHAPACQVAIDSLKMIKERKLITSIKEKSKHLRDLLVKFDNLPSVGDVRQLGLIVGVEIIKEKKSRKPFEPSLRVGHAISMEARKRGLIVRPLGDIIVFFPIASATGKDILDMTDILYESIAEVTVRF